MARFRDVLPRCLLLPASRVHLRGGARPGPARRTRIWDQSAVSRQLAIDAPDRFQWLLGSVVE
eukprot:4445551-Pyramimonas_sp.AAC.1